MAVSSEKQFSYKKAVLGGTFDRFHEAHQQLIKTAISLAHDAFIGVVSDELGKTLFSKKEFGNMIQPFEARFAKVQEFVRQEARPEQQIEVGKLIDPWGPAPTDKLADVIVVSYETENSAHKINEFRKENGLPILDIIIVPWLYQDGDLISSTRKRKVEHQLEDH